jgi:hypothetical protein
MKPLCASLLVVFSLSGISAVAGAGPMPTLAEQHGEYAQYLYKDKWQDHLSEISKNWKRYVGGLDVSKADNPQDFDGFFSFVFNTDPDFAPAFEQAKDLLEKAEGHFVAMTTEANDGELERFRHDFAMGDTNTKELKDVILQLQSHLLEAISIYEAPLRKIAYPLPRGSLFRRLQETFAASVTEPIRQMGEDAFPNLDGKAIQVPDWEELDKLNGELKDLLDVSTFGYVGQDGQKDFVSFVNFGGKSPHGWGTGSYGGDGAVATPYVVFLWF